MPDPLLAHGQARAGEITVGKYLRVTFPSAALGKTIQREGWGAVATAKYEVGLLWDCGFRVKKKKE